MFGFSCIVDYRRSWCPNCDRVPHHTLAAAIAAPGTQTMADRNRLSVPEIRIIIDDEKQQRHNEINDKAYDDDYAGESHRHRDRTINGLCDNYDENDSRDWDHHITTIITMMMRTMSTRSTLTRGLIQYGLHIL